MKTTVVIGLAALSLSLPAIAGNWPQWRGPHFNGSSDETGLPSNWSKADARWATALPGPAASTPVVWGDKVFLTAPDETRKTLHALCLDAATGRVLWNKTVGEGSIRRDERSNFAAPSPVADAGRVYFFFGNGFLAAFDHSGQELWSRSITRDYGDFAFQWTFGATPLLHGGKLFVPVLQRDVPVHGRGRTDGPIESFIAALDPATGKTLWRHVRANEAVAESKESYATPVPFEHGGRQEILIAGGDCVTGHDPATGAEWWRWATWNPKKIGHWRFVPSPVAGGGIILVCAPKGDPVYAVKAGGKGTLDDSSLAWTSAQRREVSSDVPTPLFYDHDFFILNEGRRTLSRVEPSTGNPKWTLELPGRKKYEASPTGADGKVYLMNFAGDVVVVDAREGKVLATIPMGEDGDDMIRSTVVVSGGRLFVRTNQKLFCIAN